MCSPDTGRIMEYEFMNHKAKVCLQYDKVTPGTGMHNHTCPPDTGRTLEYEFLKHKAKVCLQQDKVTPGTGMHNHTCVHQILGVHWNTNL